MVKKICFSLLISLVFISLKAQIYDPVTWQFDYEDKGNGLFELIFSANIDEGSHVYAMEIPEGGPIPTSFVFEEASGFRFEGGIFEITPPEEKYDEAFKMNIRSYYGLVEFRQLVRGEGDSFTVRGYVEYMACNDLSCSPPKEEDFIINIGAGEGDIYSSTNSEVEVPTANKRGLLGFFLGSFLLGLIGVVTPCVYPMIPLTVAFFSRGADKRKRSLVNALVFGISIVLIYASPGIIVSLTGAGAGFANTLSTHWIPNLVFFLLFLFFAVSFLGAFEITLPSGWSTTTDTKVDKGGIAGAFFMALTTVIVSFSCTGPIVGSLLVEAVRGDVLRPVVGMFAFGLAFSVPFTLFAISPTLLNRLPKSGYWLTSVKALLGYIMIAFSMKFLMTIDSVYSIGLLSREIYLILWIVLFIVMGIHFSGVIRFSGESNRRKVGSLRIIIALLSFGFVVYLVSGLFGAPLKAVSALLPSHNSGIFVSGGNDNEEKLSILEFGADNTIIGVPKYSDIFSLPYGLTGFFEYEEGMKYARSVNKPVLIDFKGHACSNCKRMEAKVWSDPEVLKRLKDNFVIIALYVDDRTPLGEEEWIVSGVDGKVKKTIGKKNEDIEITLYNTNTLPLYVIADHDGNPVNIPSVTNLDIDGYKRWLDEGYSNFFGR